MQYNQFKLKDLLEIKNGTDYRNIEKGTIPVYGSGGYMTSINKWLYDGESILLPRKGTINNIMFINGKFWTVDTMYWSIINKQKVVPYYLYNYLKALNFNNLYTGSTLPSMTNSAYYSIPVNLPSFDNQKELAHILKIIDKKIELNNKINEELEKLAKTLYNYWFIQFDFPDVFGRPYKSSGGKMVYNETLKREIPVGWEIASLKDVIEVFDNQRIPLSNNERLVMQGAYPYYGATGIMDYVNKYIFEGEYILLAEDGSISDNNGNPIVQYIWGKTWVNNHAHIIKPCQSEQIDYLYFVLKNIPVIKIETGSIQKKITQDNLLSYNVLKPKDSIINLFCIKIKPIRNMLIKVYEENKKLSQLRDFLLPMLMNGQVTIQQ